MNEMGRNKVNNWVHRSNCAYYWGGTATIRMYKDYKFVAYPIDEKIHMEAYEEKGISKLRQAGINAVFYVFDWSFPPKMREGADLKEAKKVIDICHRYNMKTIGLIQPTNICRPPYFKEIPRSIEWLARDSEDQHIMYGTMNSPSFRSQVCPNNPEWREHIKKSIKQAISIETDGILLDNPSNRGCYCEICLEKFREFVRKRCKFYSTATLDHEIERLHISLERLDVKKPLTRLWKEFCANSVSDLIRELIEYAHSLDPNVQMTTNNYGCGYTNRYQRGHDIKTHAKMQDFMMIEDHTLPRIEGGNLITSIRDCKMGRSYIGDKPVLVDPYTRNTITPKYSIPTPDQISLGIAETSACGCRFIFPASEYYTDRWTMLIADEYKKQREAAKKYYEFVDKNEKYYLGTVSAASIAVFRPHCTTWAWEKIFPNIWGFEEVLIENQIPFDLLTDEQVLEGKLTDFSVLVLPNLMLLSDEHIQAIEQFVYNGGRLVATGRTSLYDEEYRKRRNYGLYRVFGVNYPGSVEVKRDFGNGRVVFMPDAPDKSEYHDVSPVKGFNFLAREPNRIVNALKWLTRGELPLQIKHGHRYLFTELRTDIEEKYLILHLVNYRPKMVLNSVECGVQIGAKPVEEIFVISPELSMKQDIQSCVEEGMIYFTIPRLECYSVVVIRFSENR